VFSLLDTPEVLACFSRIAIDKVFDQQGNVLFSFSKRRNFNWKHMQTIKQIATERPALMAA